MAEPKTKPTTQDVMKFINSIEHEGKRKDSLELLKMFKEITKEKPVMWGDSIIGFGTYHYKSERSSQEGDWLIIGFSPRKQNLTLYIMAGNENSKDLLAKLGKHKTSVGCLYINTLADIDKDILAELIKKSFEFER